MKYIPRPKNYKPTVLATHVRMGLAGPRFIGLTAMLNPQWRPEQERDRLGRIAFPRGFSMTRQSVT